MAKIGRVLIAAVPKSPEQRWRWIRGQLLIHDLELTALARELGVTRQAVDVAKFRSYPRVEKAIANKLGLNPSQIWPERYES